MAAIEIQASAELGEGPVWDDITEKLYWIDIVGKTVHRFDPLSGNQEHWTLDQMVGCIVPMDDDKLVCALQDQLVMLNTLSGETQHLVPVESALPDNRCNDGKADAAGRLWVGTLHLPGENGHASLYRIDNKLAVVKQQDRLNMSNGLGWSPDNSIMYLNDTPNREVFQFDFSLTDGEISNRQLIFQFDESQGSPDGMCVDAEGMIWIAFYGGRSVRRFDPVSRKQLAEVSVAAENVTCCCFGGKNMDTLYITTARQGMNEEQLKEFPGSGSVFSVKPGVQGIRSNRFVM
ncbi:MAG: SMP-30/gluconolactonase/LRE family protein [Sphingobacteriales bacterium]|nr:MAG: SMP-30/gluconolactonase/LRE family protein [Sphingobacteriales bacterium]